MLAGVRHGHTGGDVHQLLAEARLLQRQLLGVARQTLPQTKQINAKIS